jgi:hypothetical protein
VQSYEHSRSINKEERQEEHAVHARIYHQVDMTYRTGRQERNLETRTAVCGRYRQVGLPVRSGRFTG